MEGRRFLQKRIMLAIGILLEHLGIFIQSPIYTYSRCSATRLRLKKVNPIRLLETWKTNAKEKTTTLRCKMWLVFPFSC
jgi:hypothetical protein